MEVLMAFTNCRVAMITIQNTCGNRAPKQVRPMQLFCSEHVLLTDVCCFQGRMIGVFELKWPILLCLLMGNLHRRDPRQLLELQHVATGS